MTPKEYLSQARHLDALIKSYLHEIDYWRELSDSVSSGSFEPRYNPNRPTEAPFVRCLEKIDEIQRSVEEKMADMLRLQKEINAVIDRLESGDERLLLRYRYIDGLSWGQIEHAMHVSERTAFRIHGSALQNISVPE